MFSLITEHLFQWFSRFLWLNKCGSLDYSPKGLFIPSVSVNAAMTLVILFSLKTMESLENRLQPHSEVTPLFSMRTEWQTSSQH